MIELEHNILLVFIRLHVITSTLLSNKPSYYCHFSYPSFIIMVCLHHQENHSQAAPLLESIGIIMYCVHVVLEFTFP
jgi:hypothetical protein